MNPIEIQFGKGVISIDPGQFPGATWDVLLPKISKGTGSKADFEKACQNPIDADPLCEIVKPGEHVVIVTADGTRPVPNKKLIPWILEQLPVPRDHVTILLGNGGHRANTPDELNDMFGQEICSTVNIVNHDASDKSMLSYLGDAKDGSPIWLNKNYLKADKRIVIGLIEPHFFCGYSGGDKGVVPGVAGIETILALHRAELIAHPESTWGTLADNPIRCLISEMVAKCPPDFLVNVTLDPGQKLHEFFLGDNLAAHQAGCDAVRKESFLQVPKRYPLVITCNCGHPLDQNLYQGVKGISCGANIVEPGGDILLIAECADGFAAHHHFRNIMQSGANPKEVLEKIMENEQVLIDQWQAQVLAQIQSRHNTHVHSIMAYDDVASIFTNPISDIGKFIQEKIDTNPDGIEIAVLPAGFQVVPIH